MAIFVKLPCSERRRLFRLVKKNIGISWEKFYPSLNISRPMFFFYLSGRYNLPKDIFLKLEKIAGIKINKVNYIQQKKYVRKNIIVPNINTSLAEILGILNGDGHLSSLNYEVCVVGDFKEKDYYLYLKNLFEKTFGITFTLYNAPFSLKLRAYSIDLFKFLTKEYNLPKGNKLNELRIPRQVFASEKLLKPYLRGIFDTDGSFYLRRKINPVVQITSASPFFLEDLKQALSSLNFKVSKGNQRIFLYLKEDIKRFFDEIKPANSKHLKKYQNYLNL